MRTLSGLDRQFHLKMGPFTRLAFYTDKPVMLLNNFMADVKSQTGTETRFFGRKKGLEHIFAYRSRYSGAGIPA